MESPIVDYKTINASAPGKFILSGEYSVVYEKQAVAAAIDLRTRVSIKPNKDNKLRLNLKNLDCRREWPVSDLKSDRIISKYSECLEYNSFMPTKFAHLLHSRYLDSTDTTDSATTSSSSKKPAEKRADDATIAFIILYVGLGDSYCLSARPPIDVEVKSDIPVGAGLGSSSAYSVALCGALMRVFRVSAEKYIISHWAFNIDKFFHGKPSGVDNGIITHGGYILFHNSKIKQLEIEHSSPIKVIFIDTCVSRSTRDLGLKVSERLKDDPTTINSIFTNINELTTQIWRNLNDTNFAPSSITTHLRANQELLDTLGVGHPKLTEIFSIAQSFGLTAKQTGAGGGGIAFVLYDDSESSNRLAQFREQLEKANYKVHDHTIGGPGLTVEVIPDHDNQSMT